MQDTGRAFPAGPEDQLWGAVGAVFGSWQTTARGHVPASARYSRRLGHGGQRAGDGVRQYGRRLRDRRRLHPRSLDRREHASTANILINAQGEDVVAGIRTPQQLTVSGKDGPGSTPPAMEEVMPEVFGQLDEIRDGSSSTTRTCRTSSSRSRQDKLYMLQTRSGKRTTAAAIRIAVEMAQEGLIDRSRRCRSRAVGARPTCCTRRSIPMRTRRDRAGPAGIAGRRVGTRVFSADEAEAAADGARSILVRIETSPEDIHGMHAAQGILTARGGMTSHAAVVARGMGRPVSSGAGIRLSITGQ